MSNLIKLEKRLNRILDSETEKGYENADTEIISECADMLLRMDSAKRYALTTDEYRNSVNGIVGAAGSKKAISHKKITVLLIAAILILLLAIMATAYTLRKTEIISFSDHYSIFFDKQKGLRKVGGLTFDGVPDGFDLAKEDKTAYSVLYEYRRDDKVIIISKDSVYESIDVDNEHGRLERKEINGTEYIIAGGEESFFNIIWEHNKNLYSVFGNIDLDSLMKIALSAK